MDHVITLLEAPTVSYTAFNDAVADIEPNKYTTSFVCPDGELLMEKAVKHKDKFIMVTLSNRLRVDASDNGEFHAFLVKHKMGDITKSFRKGVIHFSTKISSSLRFNYC